MIVLALTRNRSKLRAMSGFRAACLVAIAATACAGEAPAEPTTCAEAATVDTICGQPVLREDSWWALGGKIHLGSERVDLHGLNWFGLETPDRAPHGLWTGRTTGDFLTQIVELGFNALRVPVSSEAIRPGFAAADWARASGGTGRAQLESLLSAARDAGLHVVLDLHTCDSSKIGGELPGRPDGCDGYSIEDWIADLEALADLAAVYDPVVAAIDLTNEPHALTWTQWRDAATRGGQAVLCRNPRLLVFVNGVGDASDAGGWSPFWGENLTEAGALPVNLDCSRLVYAPHAYGPSVARPGYFAAPNFPANMPEIWDHHFGDLAKAGRNLVIGEFCGAYDDTVPGDVAWQDAFVDYLIDRDIRGFFYWALNPNAGGTGGILQDDWRTVVASKQHLLSRLIRR